jgi:ABC-type phosphate transport system substrate-binding protein
LGVIPSLEPLARSLLGAYQLAYPQETVFQIDVASPENIPDALDNRRMAAALQWSQPDSTEWAASVGWTGIVVAVNLQNDLTDLSADQTRRIFLGLTDRWEDAGGAPGDIHCLAYESGLDIRNLFQASVLHQDATAGGLLQVPAPYAMIREIQKDPFSIGYLPGFELSRDIRPLTIDHVTAEYVNLISAKYPFRVPIFLVAKAPVPPEVSRFAGWAQSAEGQIVFLNLQSWE